MKTLLCVSACLCVVFAVACGDDSKGRAQGSGAVNNTLQDVGGGDADEPDGVDGGDAGDDVGGDVSGDVIDVGPAEPGSLVIDPPAVTVTQGLMESRQVEFRVRRVEEDGTLSAVSGAFWESDNPRLGVIESATGVLTTSGVGGEASVTVSAAGVSAQAQVRVVVSGEFFGPNASPTDAQAFEGQQAEGGPALVYPEDGTMFPQNINGVSLQWRPSGHSVYQVRFQSRFVDVVGYVRGQAQWQPAGEVWRAIMRSTVNRSVTVSVAGGEGPGGVVERGAPITLNVSEDAVFGAVYYWSTTDAGIMRLPVGELTPEPFFTPAQPTGSPCVGCHALSPDGTRMAFNTAPVGLPIGPLMEIRVDDPTQRIIDLTQNIDGMQPTFNPDGTRIISGWGGVLTERLSDGRCESDMTLCQSNADCAMGDCVTGVPIRDLANPEGYSVAFPNWSLDDRWLAAAGTDSLLGNFLLDFGVPNSSIILYPHFGQDWGEPLVIVEPVNDQESHYNPAFSPDSAWIAYNYADGTDPNPDDNNANPSAELRLISPTRRSPIVLERANKGPMLSNSWPKWAPFNGRYLWLAFSSQRDIGLDVRPDDAPQIWVTAIDTVKALNGEDPSFPAFVLPGQGEGSGNHIPYWAVYEKEP